MLGSLVSHGVISGSQSGRSLFTREDLVLFILYYKKPPGHLPGMQIKHINVEFIPKVVETNVWPAQFWVGALEGPGEMKEFVIYHFQIRKYHFWAKREELCIVDRVIGLLGYWDAIKFEICLLADGIWRRWC